MPSTVTMSQLASLELGHLRGKIGGAALEGGGLDHESCPRPWRPSSAPRCTSRPNSSSWYMEQIFLGFLFLHQFGRCGLHLVEVGGGKGVFELWKGSYISRAAVTGKKLMTFFSN